MTLRDPLQRAVSIYYWYGQKKEAWRHIPGLRARLKPDNLNAGMGNDTAMAYAKANFLRQRILPW